MSWFDTILWPLKVAVAWIMVQFHTLLVAVGLDAGSGAAWALSIVGLVIVIRIALIPLFVRQIKAQRGMQLLAPEMQAIQKKYKGKTDPASREAMSRETMELYRKHGTNPFSSCLPILAQSPIFFALFRVLYSLGPLAEGTYPNADNPKTSIGPLTQELAAQANDATIFGAPISSYFLAPGATAATRIVTVALIVAMSVTTFTTQRQLTQKNMPASALEGPMAQQQKMLLYILPLVFAISGVNFPIGVLIYWTTTNLWTMGQQFYVIRRNPTPGSEAERLLKERRARKAAAKGIVLEEERPAIEEKPRGQRQQPKRKDRARPAAGTSGTATSGDAAPDDDAPASASAGAPGATPAPRKPRTRPAQSAPGQGARPAQGARPGQGTAASGAAKTAGGKPAGTRPATGGKPASGGKPATGARPATGGKPAAGARPASGGKAAPGGTPVGGTPAQGARPARKRPTTPATDAAGDAPESTPPSARPGAAGDAPTSGAQD